MRARALFAYSNARTDILTHMHVTPWHVVAFLSFFAFKPPLPEALPLGLLAIAAKGMTGAFLAGSGYTHTLFCKMALKLR